MNLNIFTGSVSRAAGGTFDAIRIPAQTLITHFDIHIRVFGVKDPYSDEDISAWFPIVPDLLSCVGPKEFGFTPDMKSHLKSSSPDLVHTHGIWMYHSFVSRKYCTRNKLPYIISPHGMLDSWALKHSSWKKKIVSIFNENSYLHGASCLHALCKSEALAMRKYGLKNYICQIPNGVDIQTHVSLCDPPWQKYISQGKKILLFLGRIHPKKGLANLIRGWQILLKYNLSISEEWSLVIAGWDQFGHENELKEMCEEFKIKENIWFVGPLFGDQKIAAYQNSDAFILPSFSEGIPMTILEAWGYELPVLMTPECNLLEGFNADAAIEIHPDPESIFEGLVKLVSMSERELNIMGINGLRLVKRDFSWEKIAGDFFSVYKWIVGGGHIPACVLEK